MSWPTPKQFLLYVSLAGLIVMLILIRWLQTRRLVPDRARRRKAQERIQKGYDAYDTWSYVSIVLGVLVMAILFVSGALIGRLALSYGWSFLLSPWLVWPFLAVVGLAGLLVAFSPMYVGIRGWRQFLAQLEQEKHLICPDCHYSLAGHREGGHCPECGYEFTPESLLEDWRDVKRLSGRGA